MPPFLHEYLARSHADVFRPVTPPSDTELQADYLVYVEVGSPEFGANGWDLILLFTCNNNRVTLLAFQPMHNLVGWFVAGYLEAIELQTQSPHSYIRAAAETSACYSLRAIKELFWAADLSKSPAGASSDELSHVLIGTDWNRAVRDHHDYEQHRTIFGVERAAAGFSLPRIQWATR
ncbi:hypothetical protein JCM11641_001430 [Rhodosporidiobolus odoratus]